MQQNIYLLHDPLTGLIKIGCSRTPLDRRRALSKQLGREVRLVYRRPIERDAFRFETRLHQHFSRRRVHGEWFRITAPYAASVIRALSAGFA